MTDKIKVSLEVYDYVKEEYVHDDEMGRRYGSKVDWDAQAAHHSLIRELGDLHWKYKRPPDMKQEFYDLLYQNSKLGNLWACEVMENWPTPVPKRTIDDYEICDEAPSPLPWPEFYRSFNKANEQLS